MSTARCAIRMRSKDSDGRKAVKLLERDLFNGFRVHDGFSSDFCSAAKQPDLHVVPSTPSGSVQLSVKMKICVMQMIYCT